MRILTGTQIRGIEEYAFANLGFKADELIEKAAFYVFQEVKKSLAGIPCPYVVLVCGKGNNGEDGRVVSKMLTQTGISNKIYDSYNISEELLKEITEDLENADIVVDGIFGTGLSREITGNTLELISTINKHSKLIISIDIPSGVSSDNGEILGVAIKADKTLSFQCPKLGEFLFPGAEMIGELLIRDLGLPLDLIDNMSKEYFLIDDKLVRETVKKRMRNSHKGDFGKVLIVAGSYGMAGAACLCANAALRAGAGLVRIAGADEIVNVLQCLVPEATCISKAEVLRVLDYYTSIVIGPGLGISKENRELLIGILAEYKGILVIDADAITMLKDQIELIKTTKAQVVLTPHEGEAARILGIDSSEVKLNRINSCEKLVKVTGANIILKGSVTLVGTKDGKIYFNNNGNPGMATGGSGDVLAGIAGSLGAQGISFEKLAQVSVYVHGLAGDLAAIEKGEYGLIASDIVNNVAFAIKEIVL